MWRRCTDMEMYLTNALTTTVQIVMVSVAVWAVTYMWFGRKVDALEKENAILEEYVSYFDAMVKEFNDVMPEPGRIQEGWN